jgi:hypothetical protein
VGLQFFLLIHEMFVLICCRMFCVGGLRVGGEIICVNFSRVLCDVGFLALLEMSIRCRLLSL